MPANSARVVYGTAGLVGLRRQAHERGQRVDLDPAGMIVVFELFAGVRAKLTGIELIVQTLVSAALGCLVIALKLILH